MGSQKGQSRRGISLPLLLNRSAASDRSLCPLQKTAPDVAVYDRNIAALKAEVLRARREAEQVAATLEDPKLAPDRWAGIAMWFPTGIDWANTSPVCREPGTMLASSIPMITVYIRADPLCVHVCMRL